MKVEIWYYVIASFMCHSVKTKNSNASGEMNCSKSGVCLPEDYDNHKAPHFPMNVDVTIRVVQITEVNDDSATIELLAWLTFTWVDNRLILMNNREKSNNGFLAMRHLHDEWYNRLWFPDFYWYGFKKYSVPNFRESFQGKVAVATGSKWANEPSFSVKFAGLWVSNCNGNVSKCVTLYSLAKMEFWCQMDFSQYPFDIQVMHVIIMIG